MSILDTNFTGIIPYEEVRNSLEEIIRGCMNNRALITDEKIISKIKKIEDTVKKILDGIDSCDLTRDYNSICAQLEKLLSSSDDWDKDLEQLKALIESHYNHIIEMEVVLTTANLEDTNRFRIKPLAVSEYQQELIQELECYKKQPGNFKDYSFHKMHYLSLFNCEVLIAGSNRILDYKKYLEYQINMLINMTISATDKDSLKQSLFSDQIIGMLNDISFELEALLKYAQERGVYQSGIVKRIEEIRQKMHQDYPMETLTFPEYQQVYTKLWTIAKQISCEYYLEIEEINAKPTDRYPLVWQVQSNLQPSEIYPHIIHELLLLIKAFRDEYDKPNNAKFKEVFGELRENLSSLKRNSIPYKNFKEQLNRVFIKVLGFYNDSNPLLLKGLLDCTIELKERTQMLEIEVANRYLNEHYSNIPLDQSLKSAYPTIEEQVHDQEQTAGIMSYRLSKEASTLPEEERYSRADQLKMAWNNTIYFQMLLEGIAKKAELCNIELLPGQSRKQNPPKEE